MGGNSERVRNVAAAGGLIALVSIPGCGSSNGPGRSDAARRVTPAAMAAPPPRADRLDASPAATPAPSRDRAVGDTLCASGETPFFSCRIGAKRVSVCQTGGGAVYRYGMPDKVEMTSRSLTFANRAYSGGGESQLTASNGDYAYTVYDQTVRTAFGDGGNDPEFKSGLVVARGGRTVSSKACEGEASVDADAQRALPTGRFVEH